MGRKIPVILFLAVLLAATLNPGMELNFTQPAPDVVQQAPQPGESSYVDEDGQPAYTPVPVPVVTPSPTPVPTPTPEPTPVPTPMVKGMSGPEVSELQGQLLTLGFLSADPDGIYGKDTEEGVKLLQTYLNEYYSSQPAPEPTVQTLGYDSGAALADEPAATPQPNQKLFIVDGVVDGRLMDALREGNFPLYREVGLMKGSTGSEAKRLQSRLNNLKYIYKNIDGAFGANTEEGLRYFQKTNGLPETGMADQNTLNLIYSPAAKQSDKPLHPYMAVVSVKDQRVYIYSWHNGKYDKLVTKMICSTGKKGSATPLGTYTESTGPGNRWHYFKDFNCWAQYAYYIEGDILFHSVLYSRRNTNTLTRSSLSNLGTRASHGCVRLKVKSAKWIWTNMNAGSTIRVKKGGGGN